MDTYRIINEYPHDPGAFTQGLAYRDGFLYEGTGLWGRSSLRCVELETGRILQIQHLNRRYFGEGITLWQERIIQLTWQSQVGFVYDRETFEPLRDFSYPTEGWGLTHNGQRLIMSDGTDTLYFLDPQTFQQVGNIKVRERGQPIAKLNELEYVNGEILANVWETNRIVRITPSTGQVIGWIDLSNIINLEPIPRTERPQNILNGIAYDAQGDRLFVTGKLWPKLFEIELIDSIAVKNSW